MGAMLSSVPYYIITAKRPFIPRFIHCIHCRFTNACTRGAPSVFMCVCSEAAFSSALGHVQPLAISGSYPSAALFDSVQFEESEDYADGASWAPSTPFLALEDAVSTTPAATEVAAVSRLAALHLEKYPWVEPALKLDADVISLDLGANKTVELEFTRDTVPLKEGTDASCARAVDGAAGACVYLTRCSAATNITLQDYKLSYCTINNKFAGVCCPTSKVDVPSN